jgi:hypothetical protein
MKLVVSSRRDLPRWDHRTWRARRGAEQTRLNPKVPPLDLYAYDANNKRLYGQDFPHVFPVGSLGTRWQLDLAETSRDPYTVPVWVNAWSRVYPGGTWPELLKQSGYATLPLPLLAELYEVCGGPPPKNSWQLVIYAEQL